MDDQSIFVCPFTILVDSQEQYPFEFFNFQSDGSPLYIPTERKYLGVAQGDYCIQGFEGLVSVERKSPADAHNTILGWGEHRERFMRELETLAKMECKAIVVECSWLALLEFTASQPQYGKHTPQHNAKLLSRQVLAWTQDYLVPWYFFDTRRLAEIETFIILERYWKNKQIQIRQNRKKELIENARHNETSEESNRPVGAAGVAIA